MKSNSATDVHIVPELALFLSILFLVTMTRHFLRRTIVIVMSYLLQFTAKQFKIHKIKNPRNNMLIMSSNL